MAWVAMWLKARPAGDSGLALFKTLLFSVDYVARLKPLKQILCVCLVRDLSKGGKSIS